MFQHFALLLLLITLSLARFDDEITTNNADQNRGDGGPLPYEPTVISDTRYGTKDVNVLYRGCDKFCAGTTTGTAKKMEVRDPFTQQTAQSFYFVYIVTDMRECNWTSIWRNGLNVTELYSVNDLRYIYNQEVELEGYQGYPTDNSTMMSYPADIRPDGFKFLIYVSATALQRYSSFIWSVRWSVYQNTCGGKPSPVSQNGQYQPGAFKAERFVNFPEF